MKMKKRFLSLTGIMALMLSVGLLQAQNRNDLLLTQSISGDYFNAVDEALATFYDDWRQSGVLKIRTQEAEDKPGSYRNLIQYDRRGNIARIADEQGQTHSVSYDKQNRIRRIYTYRNGDPYSTEFFYYNRDGGLKKSTRKMASNKKEFERFYNAEGRLIRQRIYDNGIPTKTLAFEWKYDDTGHLRGMNGPGRRMSCFYDGDRLVQIREQNGGAIEQVNISYNEMGPAALKQYVETEGDLILQKIIDLEYNNAGIVARMKEQGRDKNVLAQVTNYYYDAFSDQVLATRGDWDGGGFGYGTPVLIEWDNPEYDKLVIDSMTTCRLKLSPGINQKMPDIKELTLRLNYKDTEREIGHVVLQRKGVTQDFFIEENLPLYEGRNTIFLEVKTEQGSFSSGERYITYKNPNRQIYVRNLHILAIGVEDYANDKFDLDHSSDDINLLIDKLKTQEGKLFGEVRTKLLVDENATKENIEEAVRKIHGQAASDDLVLIYFSGHGEEFNGNFYLKPHDVNEGRLELKNTAIDNRWMLEEISRYNASTLFFMDASHQLNADEEETVDVGEANMDEVKEDFENVIDSEEDIRIFMSSTSTKQKSFRSNEGPSAFAAALLEGIEGKADGGIYGNSNGFVTVNELSEYVSDRVLGMTGWKQKPTVVKRGIGLVPIAQVK